MPKITTVAEAMSLYNNQKVELAQRLGLPCKLCGGPIKMFCCGETFPLSPENQLRVQMQYGRVWCGDDTTLSVRLTNACQELLNAMNAENVLSLKLNADGLVETTRG